MGNCISTSSSVYPFNNGVSVSSPALQYAALANLSGKQSTKWKFRLSKEEALELFEAEGSIPADVSDDELLLRICLDDPLFLYRIGHFTKKLGRKFELLLCWADILEYKSIDVQTTELLISKAFLIYHKYIKDKAPVPLGLRVSDEWREEVELSIKLAVDGSHPLAVHIFDAFQQRCLCALSMDIFQEYKLTDAYEHTLRDMRKEYNQIKPDDFVYLSKLGQGTNGVVIQAAKKSTGKLYAMKIQPKSKLLDSFFDNHSRVMSERNIVLSCNHPFIISMHYAFQTPDMVYMALDLAIGGTLHSALFSCKMGGMSEARIRFYSAEIILALNHMHQLGLIYRDLKLHNVVLTEDGHIRLIDLGEAVSVMHSARQVPSENDNYLFAPQNQNKRRTSSVSNVSHSQSNNPDLSLTNNSSRSRKSDKSVVERIVNNLNPAAAFQSPFKRTTSLSEMLNPNKNSNKSRDLSRIKLVRAQSIVGTSGYMAPELAALELPNAREVLHKIGYTKAVDYWALGVMAYQLFTGSVPFEHGDVMHFLESQVVGEQDPQYTFAMDLLRNSNITAPFLAFISNLLQIDEACRLGSGATGFAKVKRHIFFEKIMWTALSQQQMTPPFLPPANICHDETQYDVANVLKKLGLDDWAKQKPTYEEQQAFSHW